MGDTKGPLDRFFDKIEEGMDAFTKPSRPAEPDGVIDAEFHEVKTEPTVPEHTIVIARVMPSGHHHLFVHMDTTALCEQIFEARQISNRKLLDPGAEHKLIICVGCVSRAILFAARVGRKELAP